jgi:hypothetical protein
MIALYKQKSFSKGKSKAAYSVQWTCEILLHFQTFFWLRVFPAPKQSPCPPQRRYRKPLTQTVIALVFHKKIEKGNIYG